jgi:hypothetical protein
VQGESQTRCSDGAKSSNSREVLQVAPPIDDSHDFDRIESAFVAVRVGFVKDEIGTLNEDARGWTNVGTPHTKPGISCKGFDFCTDRFEDAFGRGRIVEANIGLTSSPP